VMKLSAENFENFTVRVVFSKNKKNLLKLLMSCHFRPS